MSWFSLVGRDGGRVSGEDLFPDGRAFRVALFGDAHRVLVVLVHEVEQLPDQRERVRVTTGVELLDQLAARLLERLSGNGEAGVQPRLHGLHGVAPPLADVPSPEAIDVDRRVPLVRAAPDDAVSVDLEVLHGV